MTILTTVPYFRVPRDDNERPDRQHFRVFNLALRWWPEIEDDELEAKGQSVLRRLETGDDISARHLRVGLDYLEAATDYYHSDPPEPYPGRNAEALGDLQALLYALNVPTP
jgi:hypothetical protein